MAYLNLWRLISGAESYGKNFQQFLDGGSGGYRAAAYTDLYNLSTAAPGGGPYTNLLTLAYRLSVAPDIEDELSHTSQSMRTLAATEFSALMAAVNAIETAEGETPGDYTGMTIAFTRMMSGPNSMGAWSERLTTEQITAAKTSMTALSTSAGLSILRTAVPDLYLDSGYGVTYEGTGTGTGTDKGVTSWVDQSANAYDFVQADENLQPYYIDVDSEHSRPALGFTQSEHLLADGVPLDASYGYLAVVSLVTGNPGTTAVSFSQGDGGSNAYYYGMGVSASAAPPALILAKDGTTSYNSTSYAAANMGIGYWYVSEFIKAPGASAPVHYLNGVVKAYAAGTVDIWFGDLAQQNRAAIGTLAYQSLALPFLGKIACVWGKDELTDATTIAAVRAALTARFRP